MLAHALKRICHIWVCVHEVVPFARKCIQVYTYYIVFGKCVKSAIFVVMLALFVF